MSRRRRELTTEERRARFDQLGARMDAITRTRLAKWHTVAQLGHVFHGDKSVSRLKKELYGDFWGDRFNPNEEAAKRMRAGFQSGELDRTFGAGGHEQYKRGRGRTLERRNGKLVDTSEPTERYAVEDVFGLERPARKRGAKKPRTSGPTWLTDDVRAKLGTVPDAQIARSARTSPGAVASARRKLGIKAPKRERAWLTDKLRAQLGTVADRDIAAKARVSVGTVARARRALGIAGFCGCAPPSLFGTRKRS